MKARMMMIGSALMASLIGLPAMAQPAQSMGPGMAQGGGPGMGGAGMGQRGMRHAPRDCTQTANPEACKAHQQARRQAHEVCKDTIGPDRKQCLREQMQNFDCAKASNPQQCEVRKRAYQECKGQAGPAFRQCVQQKIPAADCRAAGDPQRCEQVQKAREACKDKAGSDHMACLRAQFVVR